MAVVERNLNDEPGKPVVICVDDDPHSLGTLRHALEGRCTVLLATNGEEALAVLEAQPEVSAVLADLHMPGLAGAELLARIAQVNPHCRRVVVTGYPESDELIAAINAGHLHYIITKPWKLGDLI